LTPRRRGDRDGVDTGELEGDELPENTDRKERLQLLQATERVVKGGEHRRLHDLIREARLAASLIAGIALVIGWMGGVMRSPSSETERKIDVLRREMLDSLKAVNRRMENASERNYLVLCLIAREVIPQQAPADCQLLQRPSGHILLLPPALDTQPDASRVALRERT
jgi:hypothetical protein